MRVIADLSLVVFHSNVPLRLCVIRGEGIIRFMILEQLLLFSSFSDCCAVVVQGAQQYF